MQGPGLVLVCPPSSDGRVGAVAWEDRLKQGLCSTARQCCRRGCHRHSWPQVLRCPHCVCSVEHRLRPKKGVSSYDICCVCLFAMVAVGCVMAVLLSCLTYLVIIPLWSVTIVLMWTIMMTLFAIICLSLIEPWIPYAPQAQHSPWCQTLGPWSTAKTLRSETLSPGSGSGPTGQADNKDLHSKLLVIHGHCRPRTERDGLCSAGRSGQDAPSPKGHP
ncbi:uncharacterized protein FN964_006154 isoform 2-T2 [Alca torda]